MKLISVNLAEKKMIEWNGKSVPTGIFKIATDKKIRVSRTGLEGDHVADKKYHGGEDMAVYIYSGDHYSFWKEKYPSVDSSYGMMGENLTIDGLDEQEFCFGDTLQIGDAILQVTQPRQPCFKLGVKFGTQKIIADFIDACKPGLYTRVISEGQVAPGEIVRRPLRVSDGLGVLDFWKILYDKDRSVSDVERALNCRWLAKDAKESLRKKSGEK